MSQRVKFKICGLTTLADASLAADAGADFLGFNFIPESPRFLRLEQWQEWAGSLPAKKKVAVGVAPREEDLEAWDAAGFDFFQIHFDPAGAGGMIPSWSNHVGADRLWLAPRLADPRSFEPGWLDAADTFLIDAYHPSQMGGTGRTGDWSGFRQLREEHPGKTWILAGGLGPENLGAALAATGAEVVDLNSGVERAPGLKDPVRIQAAADVLKRS